MTGQGQRVIGVVTVIDIGDAKFDFEHCCRKGHVIVSTLVVFLEQSGLVERPGGHGFLTRPNGVSPGDAFSSHRIR